MDFMQGEPFHYDRGSPVTFHRMGNCGEEKYSKSARKRSSRRLAKEKERERENQRLLRRLASTSFKVRIS